MNPGISFYQRREEIMEALGSIIVPPLGLKDKKEQGLGVDIGYIAVHYIDVGQGDCTVIILPDTTVIMIDMGSKKDRKELGDIPFLQVQNILEHKDVNKTYIDYLILTHADGDHYNLIHYFLEWLPEKFDKIFFRNVHVGGKAKDYSGLKLSEKNELKNSDSLNLVSNADFSFEILTANTYSKTNAKNSTSVGCRLTYSNISLYFMGDAEADVEEYIVKNRKNTTSAVNILKLGHHGSAAGTSQEWLGWTDPKVGFVSAGAKWQHPYFAPIERFKINLETNEEQSEYIMKYIGIHGWVCQPENPKDDNRFIWNNDTFPVFTNICYLENLDGGKSFGSLGTSYRLIVEKQGWFHIESYGKKYPYRSDFLKSDYKTSIENYHDMAYDHYYKIPINTWIKDQDKYSDDTDIHD